MCKRTSSGQRARFFRQQARRAALGPAFLYGACCEHGSGRVALRVLVACNLFNHALSCNGSTRRAVLARVFGHVRVALHALRWMLRQDAGRPQRRWC
jgi:hypothetical protein